MLNLTPTGRIACTAISSLEVQSNTADLSNGDLFVTHSTAILSVEEKGAQGWHKAVHE